MKPDSVSTTGMGLNMCQIRACSGLSYITYNDLSPYGKFLLLLLYLDGTAMQRSIPFRCLLYPLVQGHKGPFSLFSGVCVAEGGDVLQV